MNPFKLPRHERLGDGDAAAHPALAFSGRDSYLAWVGAWKASWHATVAAIREAKRVRDASGTADGERSLAQEERHGLRILAFNLLQLRRAGKLKACQAHSLRAAA
jgi:hypothetical protein